MVMELEEFIDSCKRGYFIDYDGFGYYSNSRDTHDSNDDLVVKPSNIMRGDIKCEYKFVHWYNR